MSQHVIKCAKVTLNVILSYRCVELVCWSFGLFYSEFCSSLLAWTLCMWLFWFWSLSYLLAGGCALGRCFPASWWLWSIVDYSSSDLFFFRFLDWCLIAFICVPDFYWVNATIIFCFFFVMRRFRFKYVLYSSFFV